MTMITLNQAIAANACQSGLDRFRKAHPSITDDTPFTIGDVARVNLDDALWCLQLVDPRERVAAIMPTVKRAARHTDDQSVHDCIAALDRWLAGDDSVDLEAAAWAAEAASAASAASAAEAAAEAAAWAVRAVRAARAAEAAAWAVRAARAAEAASAAEAAAWAAEAASAAEAAAARAAAWAVRAARAAERDMQRDDLIAHFGETL